ncbi:MAG: efflux RND transporter permease subunit, partial [Polyangiales bacterium]
MQGALVGLLLALVAVPALSRLGLDSSWTALLPKDKPSVHDAEVTRRRLGGTATLTVALEGPSAAKLQAFAPSFIAALRRLDGLGVTAVDAERRGMRDFLYRHRHLYAPLTDLRALDKALATRIEEEKARANPFYIDLDEDDAAEGELDRVIARLQDRAKSLKPKAASTGYFLHPEGNLLVIFLRTTFSGGDAARTDALLQAVRRAFRTVQQKQRQPEVRLGFAGDVMHAREEHAALKGELILATSVTLAGVLLVIWLFFRRLRALPLLGVALSLPVLVTFAAAPFLVDKLNTSTAFLGSIVIGNGVNPNIIWLARYFEERRAGRGVASALYRTHLGSWLATLTASLAAAVAYASLVLTDFRGFRDFGIIGGIGMLSCLLWLPAWVVFSERLRPLRFVRRGGKWRFSSGYASLFRRLMLRHTRLVLVSCTLLTVVAATLTVWAWRMDPFEYDFRRLRSERSTDSKTSRLNQRVHEFISGSASGNAIAVLTPSRQTARQLSRRLKRAAAREPGLFGAVRSLDDLLPADQAAKVRLLPALRRKLLALRPHVKPELQRKIDAEMPPKGVRAIALGSVPEAAKRPFRERDGTLGRVVFVESSPQHSTWDGRYLVRWAAAVRQARLSDGQRPVLAGRAPIFADILQAIWQDGPKALLLSLVATALLLLWTFRRARERIATLGALMFGVLWMAGTMVLLRMRLNFLNFVAFPITFGNGVDYGVNVMRRYVQERTRGLTLRLALRRSVEQSGGAVVLCSLTTII